MSNLLLSLTGGTDNVKFDPVWIGYRVVIFAPVCENSVKEWLEKSLEK